MVQLGLQQQLTPAQIGKWGWRVPFVIGSLAAMGALYLRTHMGETAAFEQHQQSVLSVEAEGEGRISSSGQLRRGDIRLMNVAPSKLKKLKNKRFDYRYVVPSELPRNESVTRLCTSAPRIAELSLLPEVFSRWYFVARSLHLYALFKYLVNPAFAPVF